MPSFGYKLMNAVMKAILRTPLRVGPAGRIMLITYTGKKTGKIYTTPVSYTRDGDRVTFFTAALWWKNLAPQKQVTVRLRGQNYSGLAVVCADDPKAIAQGLTRHLTLLRFENNFYGVKVVDGKPVKEDVEKAARRVVMVKVRIKK